MNKEQYAQMREMIQQKVSEDPFSYELTDSSDSLLVESRVISYEKFESNKFSEETNRLKNAFESIWNFNHREKQQV